MKTLPILTLALLTLLTACQATPPDPTTDLAASGQDNAHPDTFDRYGAIVVPAGTAEKPLNMRLWYARPQRITPDTPVVLVMHGGARDADNYRDSWGSYAEQIGRASCRERG